MTPIEIINELEKTDSRLDKERILKQAWEDGCVEFFAGAKLAYDSLITFGVKKVPLIENLDEIDDEKDSNQLTWQKFKGIADNLRLRKLTGNAARDVLRYSAEHSDPKEWNNWYRRILLKDLKCGITETTINKVLKEINATEYFIQVFSCQLAKNGDDHQSKIQGWKLLDRKYDGIRLLTIVDIETKTVSQYTRDGKLNDRFTDISESILKIIHFFKQSVVLDGEMISSSFRELMTQVNRKKNVNTSDAKLALFDIIPLSEFINGESVLDQTTRHDVLTGFIPIFEKHCANIYVIPKMLVNLDTDIGKQQFKEFNKEVLDEGLEGIMVKDPNAKYKTKRTDAWLKIKPYYSCDLEIIGFEPGKPEGKFANTLGGIICKGYDNDKLIEVTVGGGYTEELRDQIWKDRDSLIGRIVEIKGDCLTQNRESESYSIRFPVFVRFRGFDIGEKI